MWRSRTLNSIKRPLRGGRCNARVRASAISAARFAPDDGWQPSSATLWIRVRQDEVAGPLDTAGHAVRRD
jgi:hypothetical protein